MNQPATRQPATNPAASGQPVAEFRYAVNVTPKPGILDPQGRAVEQSLPHLGLSGISAVRVGRRIELTVAAPGEAEARAIVDQLARELLSNPLIEVYGIELLGAISSTASVRPAPPATPGTEAEAR
ncbi:MAG: phosphoribosylformylglycinamidine synthase subunit PurS [Chloroflexota bacterium]